MSNIQSQLRKLLAPVTVSKVLVGIVMYQISETRWALREPFSVTFLRNWIVEGSGATVGDYVLHNGVAITETLGDIDYAENII